MKLLAQLIISALAVLITSFLFDGVHVDSVYVALAVAAVLSILNTIVKPVLILLTIPITVFTLGLFLLVINAVMILLADKLIPGFSVDGFWTAFFFSIILAFINSVFNSFNKESSGNREN
jgi:putative membrane protein